MPTSDHTEMFIDTLGTAAAILSMTLGPILAVAAICLLIRAILKHLRSST